MKLAEWSVKNSLLVNLMTAFVLVAGVLAIFDLKREAFPNINFDIVEVKTIYPGATPEQMENLITIPIEKELNEISDIKEMVSASTEGVSLIYITIEPDANDKPKIVNDIQRAVDRVEDLPNDLEDDPVVRELQMKDAPAIEVSVFGKIDAFELRRQAKRLEDMILDDKNVSSVVRRGYREEEFSIEVNPKKMADRYVSLPEVMSALARTNINVPGGKVMVEDKEVVLRVSGEFYRPESIEEVIVRGNDRGYSVKIKDIAEVKTSLEEQTVNNRTDGTESINLLVLKKSSGDIINLVEDTKVVIENFLKTAPSGTQVTIVNDVSFFVKRRLQVLINNGVIGLGLLIIPLVLFLNRRTALSALLGIVTSIAASFALMNAFGITINLMSLFGMIMVLGMLVDEDIVISENVHRLMEEGLSPREAAIKGTTQVAKSVFATVLTTITAFIPLLMMTGLIGKFVRQVPLVVIITLSASLIQALLVLPSHIADFNNLSEDELRKQYGDHKKSKFYLKSLFLYEKSLRFLIHYRYATLGVFLLLLAGTGWLGATRVPFILFPQGGIEQFFVRVEGDIGTPLEKTTEKIEKIEQLLSKNLPKTELDHYVTQGGIIQNDPNDPFTQRSSHVGQVWVFLTPEKDRERSAEEIIDSLRFKTDPFEKKIEVSFLPNINEIKDDEHHSLHRLLWQPQAFERFTHLMKDYLTGIYSLFPGAEKSLNHLGQQIAQAIHLEVKEREGFNRIYFESVRNGPPVGKPVSIRIRGENFDELNRLAAEYQEALSKIPGVRDIKSDFEMGKDELRATIDEDLMSRAGLTYQDVATAVRVGFDGGVATTIKKGDEEIDVVVRFPEEIRDNKESLEQLLISNNQGDLIPLKVIAKFEQFPTLEIIKHDDRKRLVSISANVDEKLTTSREVNDILGKEFKERLNQYPGVLVKYGGEEEDTQESLESLKQAFILAIFLTFIIIAVTFRSLWEPFIILTTIPMGFMGMIVAFYLDHEPLTFLAMLGIIGFVGVVVDSGIILIDFINRERRENGLDATEAIIQGSKIRLRAILLATLTTVLGVVPAAFGIGGVDPFIQPMAKAMNWGISSGSIMALFMIPVLLAIFTDILKRWNNKKLSI